MLSLLSNELLAFAEILVVAINHVSTFQVDLPHHQFHETCSYITYYISFPYMYTEIVAV